ncbi:Hypothetical protein FKW44_016538, partial [Caligus rogercresseyi]
MGYRGPPIISNGILGFPTHRQYTLGFHRLANLYPNPNAHDSSSFAYYNYRILGFQNKPPIEPQDRLITIMIYRCFKVSGSADYNCNMFWFQTPARPWGSAITLM